ncbi:serine protease [Mesorhizobium sp. M0387]|uniref:trypsin-like serine peptidase n=1 Tax=Mesorhizobium sp. M0387 TaxID=2956940 RepID=UPI00333922A6
MRTTLFLVIACLSLFSQLPPARATGSQCKSTEALTEFGRWFNPGIVVRVGETKEISAPLNYFAKALRLQLRISGSIGDDSIIVLRDKDFHFLASFGLSDLPAPAPGSPLVIWTGNLPSDQISVEYRGNSSQAAISIDLAIALPPSTTGQRVFSLQRAIPRWAPLYQSTLTQAKLVGDEVGLMVGGSPEEQGSGVWCCSAVMLPGDMALTNWHCGGLPEQAHWTVESCAATVFDFGWDDGNIRRQYSCSEVLISNERLDFALISLTSVIGSGGIIGSPPFAIASDHEITNDEPIFLVHHALCEPKRVSSHCKVRNPLRAGWRSTSPPNPSEFTEFEHDCDTEPGASGAPAFDLDGRLIGLHHAGFNTGPGCVPDRANKAIKLSEIKAFIKNTRPDLTKRLNWE